MGAKGGKVTYVQQKNKRPLKERFKMSGKMLEVADPEKYGKIIAHLAAGDTYGQVAKAVGCDWNTVARVHERSGGDLEQWRQEATKRAKVAAEMMLQRIFEAAADDERMAKEKVKDLGVAYAIALDKALLLQGEATSRHEMKSGVSIADVKRAMEEAQKRIDAEVVDV